MAQCVWIWRGRIKSRWQNLGFDYGVFEMFVKMRGAGTRLDLMEALSMPKDRLQLAQELNIDWKAVDRHIGLLDRHGLVHQDQTIGRVRMYRRTATGESLLQLLRDSSPDTQENSHQNLALER